MAMLMDSDGRLMAPPFVSNEHFAPSGILNHTFNCTSVKWLISTLIRGDCAPYKSL